MAMKKKKSTAKSNTKKGPVSRKMRDKVQNRKNRQHNRGGDFAVQLPEDIKFTPKKGRNQIDIIPYTVNVKHHPESDKGDLEISRTYWIHNNLGDEGKDKAICLKSVKKPCPICEYAAQLSRSDSEEDKQLSKDIKAKERELYNVIDLKNPDDGVKVWDISYHLFGKVLDEELNEGPDENRDFAELEGGKSLEVRMSLKKLGTNEFLEATRIDFNDRDDYDESIIEEAHSLDELLNFKTYEELEKLLMGADNEPDDDDDEDEDEEESVGSSEEEDEEEEEEEEDEDEDEEPEPAKPKKSSSSKKKGKSAAKGKKTGGKKKGKVTCPAGGVFGVDVDEFEECEWCPQYVDCEAKSEQ